MVFSIDDKKDKTYSVYEAEGQLKVTIPSVLAQAVGIRKGDKVKLRQIF